MQKKDGVCMQQQCHCAERQQIVKKGLQKLAGRMNDSLETPPTEADCQSCKAAV